MHAAPASMAAAHRWHFILAMTLIQLLGAEFLQAICFFNEGEGSLFCFYFFSLFLCLLSLPCLPCLPCTATWVCQW